MRDQGHLVEWFDEQGYGFVQPQDTKKGKVFIHIKDFAQRGPRPIVGCALDYLVIVDSQGRFRATQVAYVKRQRQEKFKPKTHTQPHNQTAHLSFMPIFITVYLIFWLALTAVQKIPLLYLAIFCAINGCTYLLYMKDKQAAQQHQWRVKEQSLHLFALLGGWPAAWVAQQKLRHKIQKQPFKEIYYVTIVLNVG
ncbi:cold shock and DUF1294 domain-containing protein, partial [Acinetobacter sp. MD2(2019)]